MENIEKVKRGIAMFVDNEVAPVMPKWKGIAFAAGAALMMEAKANTLLNHPMVSMLGVVEGDNVDVDKLYAAVKSKAQGKWPIEMAGLRMSEGDFDKLYQYIKGA